MKFLKWRKSLVALAVISLLSVSFSGGLANSAYAADIKPIFKASSCQNNSSMLGGKAFSAINSILDRLKGGKNSSIINKLPNLNPSKPPQSPKQENSSTNNTSSGNATGLSAYAQEAVNLLNADRVAQGLPALKVNLNLVRLAEDYAQDMINRGFFAHENPEGLSPFDRMDNAGISYSWAGENLAINSSVAAAQKALMSSAGHRANILNPNFTHVGIGVKKDSKGSFYVVQEFIKN